MLQASSRQGGPGGSVEAAARAETARAAMARLLAVAGHDLKQPLQIAVMAIARAVQGSSDPEVARRLDIASGALHRLGCELDDLARSSQIVEGETVRPRPVALRRLFAEVESDWRVYAEACGIALRFRAADLSVRTDPAMLLTILRNLVGNALKYARRGTRVLVGCRRRGGTVLITVHDQGPGIAPRRLATIFEAFDRGGREATPRDAMTGGLGLGLHIVRQTAEALQHPVTVRSREGRGSTFAVAVPRAGDLPA